MWLVKKCVSLLRLPQKFPGYAKMAEIDWCAEENVIRYLKSWNKKLQMDDYWNLYLINPWKPLICAHMDTVQRQDDVAKVNTICLNNEWIIKWDNIIIWWDDKCWIAIAMEMYEHLWDEISLLFPRQEETGMNGSAYFCNNNADLIKQCPYCLVLDRRNAADIISNENYYCSLEFQNDLVRVWNEAWFEYKPARWLASDANNIRHLINCVNLSVWYYAAHTKDEYIVVEEFKNAYEYAMYIVQHLEWQWPIYVEPPKPEPKPYVAKPVSSRQKTKPVDSYQWWLFWDVKSFYDKWIELWASKKDKRTQAQKTTASLFTIKLEWELQVKKNLVLYDEDFDAFVELPKGTYRVDEYKDDHDDYFDSMLT